jgi:NAD(P)-dependent dehydrogenase (short-subunit alcohol dehydrogenase family)
VDRAAPTGRIALVTGGTRGIGRAIAVRLAQDGAAVAVASRSSDGAPVVRALESAGVRAVAVQGDVSDPDQVGALFAAVRTALGEVDILVNNAAIADPDYSGAWELKPAGWRRMMAVNLDGVFFCCAQALPRMKARGWGRIVNISSTSGITGGTSGAHYAASKGGVIALSKALAREAAPFGVTVNVVAPSKIDTEMLRAAVSAEGRRDTAARIPVGRLGRPEEIADAVAYFVGEQAGYTTGQVLVVSGGY